MGGGGGDAVSYSVSTDFTDIELINNSMVFPWE